MVAAHTLLFSEVRLSLFRHMILVAELGRPDHDALHCPQGVAALGFADEVLGRWVGGVVHLLVVDHHGVALPLMCFVPQTWRGKGEGGQLEEAEEADDAKPRPEPLLTSDPS